MSHIVTIKTEVRDAAAVEAACSRLQLPPPRWGSFRLFGGEATGLGVQLPEWRYPVVCQLDSGELRFDNFGERWGEIRHLHGFLQSYAVEKTRLEAHKQGHTVTESPLADGSIKLTIQLGGAA